MEGIYLKLFVDSIEKYQKLNDAEFGRLIRAALTYKATGVEVNLMGREELLWDGMKLDIDRDNQKYADTSAGRSAAGKKGAASRWNSKMANDSKNGKCHLPYGKNGYDKDKDKDEDKDYNVSLSESHRAGADLEAAIKEFISFRKQIKKPMTDRAVSMLKTKLEKLAPGDDELKVRILEKSIYKGWTDVYELDEGRKTDTSEPRTNNPFLQILLKEGEIQ